MNDFIIKRAFSRALAIFIAFIVSYHYSLSEKFWITMTALVVMQTAIGAATRQGLERFILILVSAAVGTLLMLSIHQLFIINVLLTLLFIMSCYFARRYSTYYFALTGYFVVGFVVLIAMLLPAAYMHLFYERLYDITLGALIGISVNVLILPVRIDAEFRKNLIPVVEAYSDYLAAIIHFLYRKENSLTAVQAERERVEKILQTRSAAFPSWVYESGFSFSLQPGYRHFLVMIERVGQILFSMHQAARQQYDAALLQVFQEPLNNAVHGATEVMQALTTVLNLQKLSTGVSDLSEEITELDSIFKTAVPLPLDLLDMSKDYISLAALIQDFKDLRIVLVRLGRSLASALKSK